MQEGGDLVNHLTVFNNALAKLTRLGIKVDDDVKAVILLCSLPPSYAHLVTTLTYGKYTVKLDDISSTLLAHEQMSRGVEEKGSSGDGLFVKGARTVAGGRREERDLGRRRNASSPRTGTRQNAFTANRSGTGREIVPTREGVVMVTPVLQQMLCNLLRQVASRRISLVFHLPNALRLGS